MEVMDSSGFQNGGTCLVKCPKIDGQQHANNRKPYCSPDQLLSSSWSGDALVIF